MPVGMTIEAAERVEQIHTIEAIGVKENATRRSLELGEVRESGNNGEHFKEEDIGMPQWHILGSS